MACRPLAAWLLQKTGTTLAGIRSARAHMSKGSNANHNAPMQTPAAIRASRSRIQTAQSPATATGQAFFFALGRDYIENPTSSALLRKTN